MNNQQPGYHILTYGCQMNVRDSEIIAGLLENSGYVKKSNPEDAAVVVFNTCSVRHSAENKVYGKIGEIKKMKQKHPDLMIAVGGCMSQLPDVITRLKKLQVDVVFGTHNIHELPQLIDEARRSHKRVVNVWQEHGEIIESLPSVRNDQSTAFVNIMYGCNNFCSYCIVPYTRGRERSRQPEDVINELKELAQSGVEEVTLLGQNVNSYGRGLEKQIDFSDLLKMADEVEGLKRIRFTTSHPKDVSDRLIDTIANGNKLCEHFHIAMQSGSNDVLKRMNRGYTREHYLELTKKIRERIPGCAITTDIIVGFPGETEQDFVDTLDMIEKVRFDAAFTFMYSVRKGTRAAEFENQVPQDVKRDRLMRLNKVQYQIAYEINHALEGSTHQVLVEGPSKTNEEMLTSRTRQNRIVIFSGVKSLIGQLINVRIINGKTFSLFGEHVPDIEEGK
ncbi:MAG: tRNA (N6-isopentenyl adenosine(37)-C2)-methylthiotransferase MiaB [Bacillota bacterium]|nr:tRNA (N6-isopentenyl adenosine(37)-C2)-methylthiotransferase MiaB [Bacillota bacterium]